MIYGAGDGFAKAPCVKGTQGNVMAFSYISWRRRCVWACYRTRGCFSAITMAFKNVGSLRRFF